jgi:tetratricopeptide (TPR) repeat protein/Zn-dependent protease
MKWLKLSWKIGEVRGLEIRLHFSVLLSAIITYYIFRPVDVQHGLLVLLLLIGFVLSIFLHELAHAFAARAVRVEAKSIVIWLLGGFTTLSHEPEKPLHRAAIYAAGPFLTLVLAGLFFAAYFYMPSRLSFFWIFIYSRLFIALMGVNIILFIFNILPVYPLDGGNILHALLELFFGKPAANIITMIVSVPVLLGLIVFGFYTHDYILLIFCVLIALAIGTLNQYTRRWMDLGLNYLIRRGGYFYLQGDYDRAAYYFSRNIESKPKQVNNYVFRAICYMNTSQNEDAIADVQRVLMIDPNNELALLIRGDIYFIEKDYDLALEWYERAHQLNPNSALPYNGRGGVMRVRKEFQSALDAFDQAISLSRVFYPLSYIERSMIHYRLRNLEGAHKDQDSALHFSEKDALTRFEINLQMYKGYLDWAEDYYGRVLLKKTRSSYAYQGRADAYRANDEYARAILDYTKALRINPREPRLYISRGKCYLAIGEVDCALGDFRNIPLVTNNAYLRRQAEELQKSLTS